MKRRADCPQCHAAVRMPGSTDHERGIVPDRQLEQRVDAYARVRDRLRESLVRLDVLERERASSSGIYRRDGIISDGGGGGAAASAASERGPSRSGRRERGAAAGEGPVDDGGPPPPKRARAAAARKVRRSCAGESGSDDDDDDDDDDEDSDGDYDYPSDSKMPLDGEAAERAPPEQQKQQLKRKATVSYHNMNRKKLVDVCRKEGLNTQGNEAELKQRHSDYITLYNAECDSEHPRSVRELLNEIKSREMSIKVRITNNVARARLRCVRMQRIYNSSS